MSRVLAEAAYDATKAEGDPNFASTPGDYQAELIDRAAHVVSSGLTTNPFEEKVKELRGKAKAEEPQTPLGTTNALGEAPPEKPKGKSAETKVKTEDDADEGDEKPLGKMSREELDIIGEKEFGFNPSDYSNKAEIVAAIEQARADKA